MSEFVEVSTAAEANAARPGVATVVVSRPPTNALTRQVYRELAAAAAEAAERDDIAAVMLFGDNGLFSAGDDMAALRLLTPAEVETVADARDAAVAAVASIPKPTVAAITGYALGSGLVLALAADWRIGGDNVKFGATEILAGLIPDGGGLTRLARVTGASRAKDLVYTGRFFDADEALQLGVIDEIAAPDDVYDAAAAWTARFVAGPRHALAAAKASIDDVFTLAPTTRSATQRRRYVEVFAASVDAHRDR